MSATNFPIQERSASPSKTSFDVQSLSTLEEIKRARETLARWKEMIGDRLGQSRLEKDKSPQGFDAFVEDRTTFDKYKEVTGYLSDAVSQAQTEMRTGSPQQTHILVAIDPSTQTIQGMSASSLEAHRVYLKSLISAPWNIPMHAPLEEEQKSLVVKGAGKTLVAKTYALAQQSGKPQLETTPLASAFTFYQSIGMSFDQEQCTFKYDVTETPPSSLAEYF